MSALLGIVVVALVAYASGVVAVLSTLPGDCFDMRDLWDAWRRGDWPTVSRLCDRDRWLDKYRRREAERDQERWP